MKAGEYIELMNCHNEDEVIERIREWSSDLSPHEHLIRSTILEIQASLEGLMKDLYCKVLLLVLFQGNDEKENMKNQDDLKKSVTRLSFSSIYRILRPILQAYPDPDLTFINEINELRNQVAHLRNISEIQYKGRNPFHDVDALAQIYWEARAARDALRKFYQIMIKEPNSINTHYAKFYRENFEKEQTESDTKNLKS